MDLKTYVTTNVDADKYYHSRFKYWSPSARNNVTCPFHDDVHPSLSVGLDKGAAKCWAGSCGRTFGSIIHFEAARKGCNEETATIALYSEFIRPLIDGSKLATLQTALGKDAKYTGMLRTTCALGADSIRLFGLGLDRRTKRLAIPIFDRWGNLINIRLYKPKPLRTDKDENFKVLNFAKGYGALDLFPWPMFLHYDLDKPLFVMASEKECMVAIEHGLQAICGTCGEGAWEQEWSELLAGFNVCIVGQNDDGGKKAAAKRYEAIVDYATSCSVLHIATLQKDFADWVAFDKGSGLKLQIDYNKTKGQAPETPTQKRTKSDHQVSVGAQATPKCPPYYDMERVELAHVGTHVEMLNKIVKCTGIVAAKATHTYSVPWKFTLKPKNTTPKRYAVSMGRELISFVNSSDGYIRQFFRDTFDDQKMEVKMDEWLTITEVEVIPTAAVDRDIPYVIQRCYFVGKWIDANVPYELEIIPTTEIKTQKTVGIIVSAKPISLSFENLLFSENDFATLQIFRPQEDENVYDKMMSLAEELAENYTKIYNRPDWHLVALLSWVSPIGFRMPYEEKIQRGWLNSLAIGDTQTGKSQVVEAIQNLTKCGQFVNSENCTYVGLVGGAVKMGSNQFMLRWGRIPLCDKQLVVLEELSGLSVEHISHMSDVRSSGIARLDKAGIIGETNARTRLIALSNPRSEEKPLAAYISGVRAIQELIGHGEDIARFDLVITLVDSDVSLHVINQPARRHQNKLGLFEPSHLQRLVQFAWALKPEQILITTEAYLSCLELTIELAEQYHPSVPLFKGGSGRYKIARIAAAIATLQFSWDEDRKKIIVNEEHVEAAVRLMRDLYNKPPLRYDEWSKQMFDREDVKDVQEIIDLFAKHLADAKKRAKVIETLIHAARFNRDELCAIASIPIMHADEILGVFLRNRVIRKGSANTWEITPPGKRWLESVTDQDIPASHHRNGHSPNKTDAFTKA